MRQPTAKRIASFDTAVAMVREQYVVGNFILAASNLAFITEVIKYDARVARKGTRGLRNVCMSEGADKR